MTTYSLTADQAARLSAVVQVWRGEHGATIDLDGVQVLRDRDYASLPIDPTSPDQTPLVSDEPYLDVDGTLHLDGAHERVTLGIVCVPFGASTEDVAELLAGEPDARVDPDMAASLVDEFARRAGDDTVQIYLDGKRVWESPRWVGPAAPAGA